MALGLNANDTPKLFKEGGKELPVESVTGNGADRTAYLNIDLKVLPLGGKDVTPMTAVFAPDPKQLPSEVDVILWFHGDKSYWEQQGGKSVGFAGESIKFYLEGQKGLTLCKLREFILPSKKKQFILVAPTLNDRTGGTKPHPEPGLVWDQVDAGAYLQQAVNSVKAYMGAKQVSGVGNIIVAAHSGGGHLQDQMAQFFSGKFDRAHELWCFDSMYWGSNSYFAWINKGHFHARLFMYSTGSLTPGGPTTASNAHDILRFKQNIKDAKKLMKFATVSPPKPKHARTRSPLEKGMAIVSDIFGTAGAAVGTMVHAVGIATTQIDVLIEQDPDTGGRKTTVTDFFLATYGGPAGGHYEGMKQYLQKLVETSRILQ